MQAVNLRLARPEEAALLLQIHHASVQGLCGGQYNAEQIAHRPDVSQDNLFHTVLGGLNVHTQAYNAKLDLFNACSQGKA